MQKSKAPQGKRRKETSNSLKKTKVGIQGDTVAGAGGNRYQRAGNMGCATSNNWETHRQETQTQKDTKESEEREGVMTRRRRADG